MPRRITKRNASRPKVALQCWGDSHFSNRHHFQSALNEQLDDPHYKKYLPPTYQAISGGRICQRTVQDVKHQMNLWQDGPQCHILEYGHECFRSKGGFLSSGSLLMH